MPQPTFEVADIFRAHGQQYRAQHRLPYHQLRLMNAIESCRTAALGGHVETCGHCGIERISYNSCCNRCCPKCQNLARAKWLTSRQGELLPIDYYHVVFTIPEQLNDLALRNQSLFYKLMFDASAATLQSLAADPKHLGAKIGFFSILHTWGQNLLFHPHIHCVVTGGGVSADHSRWISCRPEFFIHVKVLSARFRTLLLNAVELAFLNNQLQFPGVIAPLANPPAFRALIYSLKNIDWVVYAKAPFGGPLQVLQYLGRYTHRVAISNQRILDFDNGQVTFQYKNYRSTHSQKSRRMTIPAEEFIRRFLLHSLPPGFQRIRHYGLFASRKKKQNLALCRQLLHASTDGLLPSTEQAQAVVSQLLQLFRNCAVCHIGLMIRTAILSPIRAPSLPRSDSS
jgi:hypothetical protein